MADAAAVVRRSLAEQLARMRGIDPQALPPALLDVTVRRVALPGGDAFVALPADWEQLRHEEGGAGRPVPYWARLWPSGLALAAALAADPPSPGVRVLELGCGLALPSVVAARASRQRPGHRRLGGCDRLRRARPGAQRARRRRGPGRLVDPG
jgi:hypothetical protein